MDVGWSWHEGRRMPQPSFTKPLKAFRGIKTLSGYQCYTWVLLGNVQLLETTAKKTFFSF
jgi:hypothetical protein